MSLEAEEAAERRARQSLHHARQYGAYGPGHIHYIPPELLCVLAGAREGSRMHKIVIGPGGAGTCPLGPEELACATATSPEFAAMVAAAEAA